MEKSAKKRVLLTGGSGFVGSHFLSHILASKDWEVVVIASWTHKGLPYRILEDDNYRKHKDRVTILTHDLNNPFTTDEKKAIGKINYIFNLASDSHVDRSITEPVPFIMNNVNLVLNMLELAREIKPEVFLQFSTDEVYGQCPIGMSHVEWSPIIPSNPYSGSKAAQEAIAIAYWRSYGVPVIITNTMNIFGERQDEEKFIPLCIRRIQTGEKISIHAYPDLSKAGSRFYLHARNAASAICFIAENLPPTPHPKADRPDRYNVVGELELDNLTLAQKIAEIIGKPLNYELINFHSSRPGHDCRYALDGTKLAKLGWVPTVKFEDSLKQTVKFAMEHPYAYK